MQVQRSTAPENIFTSAAFTRKPTVEAQQVPIVVPVPMYPTQAPGPPEAHTTVDAGALIPDASFCSHIAGSRETIVITACLAREKGEARGRVLFYDVNAPHKARIQQHLILEEQQLGSGIAMHRYMIGVTSAECFFVTMLIQFDLLHMHTMDIAQIKARLTAHLQCRLGGHLVGHMQHQILPRFMVDWTLWHTKLRACWYCSRTAALCFFATPHPAFVALRECRSLVRAGTMRCTAAVARSWRPRRSSSNKWGTSTRPL